MKKVTVFLFLFFALLSCKKKIAADDPTPIATICQVQKISYSDGAYELYKFNANKLLSEVTIHVKISDLLLFQDVLVKFEYNAQGNLLKASGDDGSTDNYIYDANGLLTRVDFKDKSGTLTEQFTVTMDSQKRLTKVVVKNSGLTGAYEYNGQDNALSKVEVSSQGKIIDLNTVQTWQTDKTKKGYKIAITGHPFDPGVLTGDMVFYPFSIKSDWGLPETSIYSTNYDEKWEKLTNNLRIYSAFKTTYKYNSNNFVIERIANDAVTKTAYTNTYTYSNCN
jgi:YD repeat-containing protein